MANGCQGSRVPTLRIPGLAHRIRALVNKRRAELGLTSDRAFADLIRVDATQLSLYMNERNPTTPTFSVLEKLATAFGVPWQQLLVGEGDDATEIMMKPRGSVRLAVVEYHAPYRIPALEAKVDPNRTRRRRRAKAKRTTEADR